MANQIQATVYQIDGSPLNNSIQIAFLTSNVYMREFQTDLIPAVNSAIVYYPNTSNQLQEQTFLVSETITALVSSANAGGTTQISTTVLEINQEPQIPSGVTFSFPVQGISIWPVANPVVGGVNSYLEFKNKKYYLLEDEGALVTAANVNNNSGSTGVNGLNGTTNIGLGGTLSSNTTISGSNYNLNFNGTNNFGINNNNTSNAGSTQLNFSNNQIELLCDSDTTQSAIYITNLQINTTFDNSVEFGLLLDNINGKCAIGDYSNQKNSNSFVVNDDTNEFYLTTSFSQSNTAQDLFYANNASAGSRFVKIGDFNEYTNGVTLIIDDANSLIYTQSLNTGSGGIEFNFQFETYKLGANNAYIECDNLSQLININSPNIILNNTPQINNATITNTATATIPSNYLSIQINGNNYKILLLNP
jgi:hypothetical protein